MLCCDCLFFLWKGYEFEVGKKNTPEYPEVLSHNQLYLFFDRISKLDSPE